MQYDYTKPWAELFQYANKSLMALAELNVNACNKFIPKGQEYLENILQAKKPEVFVNAQIELLKGISAGSLQYWQEFFDILNTSFSESAALSTAKPGKHHHHDKA